jgi:hypothetical protein
VILFLDFDGVLHPENIEREAELLCCRKYLWAVLEAVPTVEVVFTTTWRRKHRIEELVSLVTAGGGEHLASHFVGATPEVLPNDFGDTYRSREKECLAWLYGNGQSLREWVAVDDMAYWFSFPQPRLVLIDPATGLTANDVNRIVARLHQW